MKFKLYFQILTLFPEMFPGHLSFSLSGKALKKELWSYKANNIRDYGIGKHKKVDDKVYGGGNGFVMRPDVLNNAILDNIQPNMPIYYMSPRGTPINNDIIDNILEFSQIMIICGRYEGIDQRVIDKYNMQEVCVGDVILLGGESAALLMMEAAIRKVRGVINSPESLEDESFVNIGGNKLLEYPLYTQPSSFLNLDVPEILLSGNHKKILEWRRNQSLDLTKKRRPDIL